MRTPTVHAGDQGGLFRGRQNGGRRAALIGRRLKQGRGRARFTRGSKLTGMVWRPRHVGSRVGTSERSGTSPWQHCRLKFAERELQKCTFNRKEALFTPSDSAPGYHAQWVTASRACYPYMLSKRVFGPRPDCNLWESQQLSHRSQPSIGRHLASSCPSVGPCLFSRRPLFLRRRHFWARGQFFTVRGHGFPNVDCLIR